MKETTMESTTMCECCEKRPAEHTSMFNTQRDVGEVHYCDVCDNAMPLATLCDRIRSNRRRSRPAAEPIWHEVSHVVLEVGDRVRVSSELKCYGEGFVQRLANERGELLIGGMPGCSAPQEIPSYWKFEVRDTPAPKADSGFKVGDRVQLRVRDFDMREALATVRKVRGDEIEVVWLMGGHTSWEHACDFEAVSLPPSEDPKRQPEANPLRPIPLREEPPGKVLCISCKAPHDGEDYHCRYCWRRIQDQCEHDFGAQTESCRFCTLDQDTFLEAEGRQERGPGIARIASATPVEVRMPWDWPVDSDAPDGVA